MSLDHEPTPPAPPHPCGERAVDLIARAAVEGVPVAANLSRSELLAAVLSHRLARGEIVHGEGVLELLPEGYGFLRCRQDDYEATPADAYVSPSQVRSLNLKAGHLVRGPLRAPKGNERYFALVHVDRVNGVEPAGLGHRITFAARTPVVPDRPLRLGGDAAAVRCVRALAPWCRGHRALVVAPPTWPRALLLADLAAALRAGDSGLRLVVCLLDQRPEDLAAVRARLAAVPECDVVGTGFDQLPERHLALADLVLARVQREVEGGADAVLLLDSLTALVQARQREQPASGRWLCPGLDAQAVLPAKRLFAAARACAEGGSLTIVATALGASGVAVDDAVLAEFRHRANSEVIVDPALAASGDPMPLDLRATHTRPEDDLRPAAQKAEVRALRQRLAAATGAERLALLAAADG